jgi:hypothetical protein
MDISDSHAVLMELRVQLMDNLDMSSRPLDSDVVLLINRFNLMLDIAEIVLTSVKCSSQTSDGSHMSLKANIVVVQVVSED